ncbi:hypothetical protein [Agrobacterium sp. SOY23]|uniref:hypothetical protein n=1 Tax=Agrobacterium sp. SOY23 TaxID=3014555 RepID=UPI003FA44286
MELDQSARMYGGQATWRDGVAKGANTLTTSPRISQIGDAYLPKMLVTAKTPSSPKLKSSLCGKPEYRAGEKFGRAPGLKDFAASQFGLPPSWTDKAAR